MEFTQLVLALTQSSRTRILLTSVVSNYGEDIQIQFVTTLSKALASMVTPPVLVIIDQHSVGVEAPSFIRAVRNQEITANTQILLLVTNGKQTSISECMKAGVSEILTIPALEEEWFARLNSVFLHARQNHVLALTNEYVLSNINHATALIRESEVATLHRLASIIEFHACGTVSGVLRISSYVRIICQSLGMDENEIDVIEKASPLHDIGEIAIPDSVLRRNEQLSEQDYVLVRQHPSTGYEMLRRDRSKYLEMASTIALSHHERFDGSGYPTGLRHNEIPIAGRIVALADVFDAITSERPSRGRPYSFDEAVIYIVQQRSLEFDPDCCDAFMRAIERISAIHQAAH